MAEQSYKSSRAGMWIVVSVLLVILVFSTAFLYVGWGMGGDHPENSMTSAGYTAMTIGIVATLALGVGLMALVFYSSRSGRD